MSRKKLTPTSTIMSCIILTCGLILLWTGPLQEALGSTTAKKNLTKPVAASDSRHLNTLIIPELQTRPSRRAFFTAPPVIPHKIGSSEQECLSCHAKKRTYKGATSNLTPHPEYKNCEQCHVRGTPPQYFKNMNTKVKTSWKGLKKPGKGTRQHDFAPPTIPHPFQLRENCNACHSTRYTSQPGLLGPHPYRHNCFQCHVMMDSSTY